MGNKIKEILSYAVAAPSGDNSQPWRFVLFGNILKIYNLPEKDNFYLNYMQSGSFIAHGALLKNIEIASTKFNLLSKITLFPSTSEENLIAEVIFEEMTSQIKVHPLVESIFQRSTNRRPYKNIKFSTKDEDILKEAGDFEDISLKFITDIKDKKIVGAAGSSAEIVILENTLLHQLLFKDVMWSEEQEKKEKHGLYIKTMEFNPVQSFLFKLASNPHLMRFAVKINFPHFIAKQDASLYASGSAIGILTLKNISKENFIKLGMKMQEVWLKTTALGLAFQPITATLFLGFKLLNNVDDTVLNQEHKNLALDSYKKILAVFNLKEQETPFFMFRIGYAKKPSARSSRKDPEIEVSN